MDIDYSNFAIQIIEMTETPEFGPEFRAKIHIGALMIAIDEWYTSAADAHEGAKRAIKRIVETAVGAKFSIGRNCDIEAALEEWMAGPNNYGICHS